MSELEGLLARVMAATGPDRKIDEAVAATLSVSATLMCLKDSSPEETGLMMYRWEDGSQHSALRITASVDAAEGLVKWVLPRWSLCMAYSEGLKHPVVTMGRSYPTNRTVAMEHHTMPLAIVSALLSALIAQETPTPGDEGGRGDV